MSLLVTTQSGKDTVRVGTAETFPNEGKDLAVILHGHDVREMQVSRDPSACLVRKANITRNNSVSYHYRMKENEDEPVPENLGEMVNETGKQYVRSVDQISPVDAGGHSLGKRSSPTSTEVEQLVAKKKKKENKSVVELSSSSESDDEEKGEEEFIFVKELNPGDGVAKRKEQENHRKAVTV